VRSRVVAAVSVLLLSGCATEFEAILKKPAQPVAATPPPAPTPPAAPAPNMCWFWADSTQTSGYWDYCRVP